MSEQADTQQDVWRVEYLPISALWLVSHDDGAFTCDSNAAAVAAAVTLNTYLDRLARAEQALREIAGGYGVPDAWLELPRPEFHHKMWTLAQQKARAALEEAGGA